MMLKVGSGLITSGELLIKLRLFIYIISLLQLATSSTYLLGIDFSKSKDPHLRMYNKLKWKLITTWFNLLRGPYLLMSISCEWNKLKQKGNSRFIKLIDKSRNFLFSTIILPVTVFGDIFFWCLYFKNRKLVMPLSADEVISTWDQHSMHTVSLLFVLFDLICVPRKRPEDMKTGLSALTGFITLYISVCIHSALSQEYVYPAIRILSPLKLVTYVVYIYIANFFYYTGQWVIVDIIWNRRGEKLKIARYLYTILYFIIFISCGI